MSDIEVEISTLSWMTKDLTDLQAIQGDSFRTKGSIHRLEAIVAPIASLFEV